MTLPEGSFARGYSPGHAGRDEYLRDPFLALYGPFEIGTDDAPSADGARPQARRHPAGRVAGAAAHYAPEAVAVGVIPTPRGPVTRALTSEGLDAAWEAVGPAYPLARAAWERTFFGAGATVSPVEVDTSMASQGRTDTAQALVGLAGVVNRCGADGVCYYQPSTQRATLALAPAARGRVNTRALTQHMLQAPQVTSAEVVFEPVPKDPLQGPSDIGYRGDRTGVSPPVLPATYGDAPIRLGAWVTGYDEARGYVVRPVTEWQGFVPNAVSQAQGEQHAKQVYARVRRGKTWPWWKTGGGLPTNESLTEAQVTLDDLKKYLVPRKSVVMGGKWWTVTQRDLASGKVDFRLADWEDGSGTRTTTIDTILRNVNAGKWGMSILNKGHIGKDSPRFTGGKAKDEAAPVPDVDGVDLFVFVCPSPEAAAQLAAALAPAVGTPVTVEHATVRGAVASAGAFAVVRGLAEVFAGRLVQWPPVPVYVHATPEDPVAESRVGVQEGTRSLRRQLRLPEEIHRANPFPGGSDAAGLYHELMQALRRGEVAPTAEDLHRYVASRQAGEPIATRQYAASGPVIQALAREGVVEAAPWRVASAFTHAGRAFTPGDVVCAVISEGSDVAVYHLTLAQGWRPLAVSAVVWQGWFLEGRVVGRSGTAGKKL